MTQEQSLSCGEGTPGPTAGAGGENERPGVSAQAEEEVSVMTARVGQEAPDFEARALVDGGFKNVKLSDYRGKWVVLCFYPGDFTFV